MTSRSLETSIAQILIGLLSLSLSGASPNSTSLCNFIFTHNLMQHISDPTHSHGNILDLVLSNCSNRISEISIDNSISSFMSDHYLININSNHSAPFKPKPISFFNYSNTDFQAMVDFLMNIDFYTILLLHDADLMWHHLRDLISLFITKLTLFSHPSPKWFNSAIHHQINCIHSLHRKIKKFNSQYLTSKLSNMELKLQNMITSSKAAYETSLIHSFHLILRNFITIYLTFLNLSAYQSL